MTEEEGIFAAFLCVHQHLVLALVGNPVLEFRGSLDFQRWQVDGPGEDFDVNAFGHR